MDVDLSQFRQGFQLIAVGGIPEYDNVVQLMLQRFSLTVEPLPPRQSTIVPVPSLQEVDEVSRLIDELPEPNLPE